MQQQCCRAVDAVILLSAAPLRDLACHADSREGRGTVLSCEAEAYASFKQKWTLKLAKSVSSIFADKTSSYRRRSNFEAFASYGVESRYVPN